MDDELRMLRSSLREFIAAEFEPAQPRWRAQHGPDPDAWKKVGDIGILLSDMPEEYGGGGGSFAHEALASSELARAGVHLSTYVHNSVAHYIHAYATEAQKRDWLPRMATGDLVAAVALSEPAAGSDLAGIKATARRDGDEYVINGSKTFVTSGANAGLLCLAVKTDPKAPAARGLSLLIVETKGLAGYRVGRPLEKLGMQAQDTCEIFFDDARVPAANLLGSVEGRGISQVMEQMTYERLAIAVTAMATAERAVEITTRYAKERKAFGQSLMDFQNTRFKLAECQTDVHVGRVFLDSCIDRYIAGQLDSVTAAQAKYWLTDCECRVIDECLQLHGGYGYMTEYPIARMWADSRVHRIYGGTNEIMKESIGWSL